MWLRQSTASQEVLLRPAAPNTLDCGEADAVPTGEFDRRGVDVSTDNFLVCNTDLSPKSRIAGRVTAPYRAELGPLMISIGGDKYPRTAGARLSFDHSSADIRVVQRAVRSSSMQFQIFDPVVGNQAVFMVDDLVRRQRSAEMFAHDEPVLKYIPADIRVRVPGLAGQYISVRGLRFAAVPSTVALASATVPADVGDGDSSGFKSPSGAAARAECRATPTPAHDSFCAHLVMVTRRKRPHNGRAL